MFMTLLLMLLLIWIPRFPWNAAPIFSNYEIFKSLPSTEEAEIPYWDYWGDPLCIIISTIIFTTMAFSIVWSICPVTQETKVKDGSPTGPSAETADPAPDQVVPSQCNQPVGESRKKKKINIDREKTKKRRKKKKKRKKKGR